MGYQPRAGYYLSSNSVWVPPAVRIMSGSRDMPTKADLTRHRRNRVVRVLSAHRRCACLGCHEADVAAGFYVAQRQEDAVDDCKMRRCIGAATGSTGPP